MDLVPVSLLLEVDAFDAGGDGGEHLVGDGAGGGGVALQEVAFAEEDDGVAFAAFHTRDVDEAHVHADAADDRHLVAGDNHMALFVAEVAVEAVGIADGDDGDARGTRGYPAAIVTHGFALGDVLELRNAGDETRHLAEPGLHLGLGSHAIEADAEAYHIHLGFGEAGDAGGVEDVVEYLDAGGTLDEVVEAVAPSTEAVNLPVGEVVHRGVVGTGQMGEDALHLEAVGALVELAAKVKYVALGEAQAVHAGVELHMDGPAASQEAHTGGEKFQDAEGVDIGLEVVFDDVVERGFLGIHHHDGDADAIAAQVDAFVGIGHGEVVDMTELEGAGHLDFAGTVGGRLDHSHELGLGADKRTVVVEVVYHRPEVDLHDGLVRLALEELGYLLEAEDAGTLEEDGLVLERVGVVVLQELLGGVEEERLDADETVAVVVEGRPDGDEPRDAALRGQLRHLGVELAVGHTCLQEIANDKGLTEVLMLVLEVVEGDGEGVEIEAVAVVDEEAVVDGLVHLETHLDGGELSAAGGDGLGGIA